MHYDPSSILWKMGSMSDESRERDNMLCQKQTKYDVIKNVEEALNFNPFDDGVILHFSCLFFPGSYF